MAIVIAGVLALILKPAATTSAHTQAFQRAAVTRGDAAAWIASQVSRATVISCDPVMCRALASHGFPGHDLLKLKPGGSPLRSTLVVATAAIRRQLGGRLSSVDAPAVIARFGFGGQQIDVRTVAQRGAAEFNSALTADLQQRKEVGAQLLSNSRIGAGGLAGTQLSAGQVDSRLLFTIFNLAGQRPIEIVAFGDGAPGVNASISPLRSVELQQVPGTPHLSNALFMTTMLGQLRRQPAPYVAASAQQVRLPGQGLVLRIEFSAPSPLGLLGGSTPTGG